MRYFGSLTVFKSYISLKCVKFQCICSKPIHSTTLVSCASFWLVPCSTLHSLHIWQRVSNFLAAKTEWFNWSGGFGKVHLEHPILFLHKFYCFMALLRFGMQISIGYPVHQLSLNVHEPDQIRGVIPDTFDFFENLDKFLAIFKILVVYYWLSSPVNFQNFVWFFHRIVSVPWLFRALRWLMTYCAFIWTGTWFLTLRQSTAFIFQHVLLISSSMYCPDGCISGGVDYHRLGYQILLECHGCDKDRNGLLQAVTVELCPIMKHVRSNWLQWVSLDLILSLWTLTSFAAAFMQLLGSVVLFS